MEGLECTCSSLFPAVLNFLHLSEVQWEPRVIYGICVLYSHVASLWGRSLGFLASLR